MQNRSIPLSEWVANADRGEGFMVAVKGAGAPGMVHPTIDGAEAEGRRLIAGLPTNKDQTAMVLRVERILRRGAALVPGTETIVDRPPIDAAKSLPPEALTITRSGVLYRGGEIPEAVQATFVIGEKPSEATSPPMSAPAPVPASKPAEYFTGEFVKWTRDTGEIAYGYAVGPHRVITSGGDRLDVEVLRLEPGQKLGPDMPTKGDYIIPTSMLSLYLRTVAGGGWREIRGGRSYLDGLGHAYRVNLDERHQRAGGLPFRCGDRTWDSAGMYTPPNSGPCDLVQELRNDA